MEKMDQGKLTIWSQSQGVFLLRSTIAHVLQMDPEDIRVIHAEGAGCYGHNGSDDAALDAALLARAIPGTRFRSLRLINTEPRSIELANS